MSSCVGEDVPTFWGWVEEAGMHPRWLKVTGVTGTWGDEWGRGKKGWWWRAKWLEPVDPQV